MFRPPPADLAGREPIIYSVADTEVWFRSHRMTSGPVFFGRRMANRWDAPHGEYGVLYVARDPYCAFMESIGRNVLKTRFVPKADLTTCGLSKVQFSRALRLIDMAASGGLTRLGAEGSLTSGAGYKNSQRWSKALREHPSKPDGILYCSRYDPSRIACALYDHCEPAMTVISPAEAWADQPVLLGAILDQYRFGTDLS